VHVTNVTGDTITMVRAQEGTSALAWSANDLFDNLITAGTLQALVQQGDAQQQGYNYGVDTGSANAYAVALSPTLSTAPSAGIPIRFLAANSNTGASTLNAGWGVVQIVRRDGSACIGGEIIGGQIVEVFFDGTKAELKNVAPATAAAISAGTDTQSGVTPAQLSAAIGTALLVSGQCRLGYTSATAITLAPYNGDRVPVAGALIALPAAGVSAANTNVTVNGVAAQNLANSSVYLVALNQSGTLEYWSLATGHSPDSTAGNIGVEIITGHANKTLVGMVVTNSSGQFSSFLVLSWFNRQLQYQRTNFTVARSVNSGAALAEINAEIRNSFLLWAGQNVPFNFSGYVTITSGNDVANTAISFDGAAVEPDGAAYEGYTGNTSSGFSIAGTKTGLSEGLHYATVFGQVTVASGGSAGSAAWNGSSLSPLPFQTSVLGISVQG
jgi:hypothetical protein